MKKLISIAVISAAVGLAGCGQNASNTAAVNNSNAPQKTQAVTAMGRPKKITDMMQARGEQDAAAPVLKIVEPKENAVISGSTVKLKLEISGDLKGYMPGMDAATHTGNHIHVILDNQPYEAYYNLDQDFELRNVSDGPHTIRVFPSRPWHESYKNEGAFQMVNFTVKNGGADATKPATTANGNTMSNANTGPTPEGKDMKESTGGKVDLKRPLLTYSRPKGDYKGADAENIMVDFWVLNTDLSPNGQKTGGQPPCPCKIRYAVDGVDMGTFNQWAPLWLNGLSVGTHKIKLELIGHDGSVIDNGGYNSTEREFTVSQ